jgi:hypothetical protein
LSTQDKPENKMKKYVENDTAHMLYVGGCAIAPGEGREVDVPDNGPAQPAADELDPTLADQVALLLKDSQANIVKSLGELNNDTLDMMAALEEGTAKPRAKLLTAIADERIKRADAALTTDPL